MSEIKTTQLDVIKINDLIEASTILDSDYALINSKGVTKRVNVSLFKGLKGDKGVSGKELELAKDEKYIKWRYVGDSAWKNLIPLSELKGNVDLTDYALKAWVNEQIYNTELALNSLIKIQSVQPQGNGTLIWFETELIENDTNLLWFEIPKVKEEQGDNSKKLWFEL